MHELIITITPLIVVLSAALTLSYPAIMRPGGPNVVYAGGRFTHFLLFAPSIHFIHAGVVLIVFFIWSNIKYKF